jgi:hypothetical protein
MTGAYTLGRDTAVTEREMALDAVAEHLFTLRRAAQLLYTNGMCSQGDHARVMLKIRKREHALVLQAEQGTQP